MDVCFQTLACQRQYVLDAQSDTGTWSDILNMIMSLELLSMVPPNDCTEGLLPSDTWIQSGHALADETVD